MILLLKCSWYVILVCLVVSISHAKSRTCRVVFPERPNDAPKAAYLFDGAKSQNITLPSMNLSEVIELPVGNITLTVTSQEIKDPKLLPVDVPKLNIPENVTDCYIIVLADPTNKHLPIKLNLVDAGDAKLKNGETLWYNFTKHQIFAKLGKVDLSIKPGSRAISQAPVSSSGYYIARFAYKANGTAPPSPITEQSWWYDVDHKHVGFMVNTGGKLPKIYYYRDFRMKEEPAQANTTAE
jgi:hypothetical protein